MTLNPLPLTKLEVLRPILDAALVELNLSDRSSADFLLNRLKIGYSQRSIDAYVDDINDPKHVLVLERSHGGVTKETLCEVRFVYSVAEHRGDAAAQKSFIDQIEQYSKIFNCDAILASSWVYQGSQAIDALWKGSGYELQERVYVKRMPT